MPIRISGVDLSEKKQIKYALTNIKGIGQSAAAEVLDQAQVKHDKLTGDLTETELKRIREIVENKFKTEGDLKLEVSQNVRRLKDINSYKGDRHKKNLPVKGQRTKTNARTKRGRRVTVGSGRKPAAEKT